MADLVRQALGKQYFDKFRSLMVEFKSIEEGLMNARKAENTATISLTY